MKLKEKKAILDLIKNIEDEIIDCINSNGSTLYTIETVNDTVLYVNEICKGEAPIKDIVDNILSNIDEIINLNDINHILDELKKLLSLIEQLSYKIEKYVRGKLEIVFFPYKASMWDSFESVWMEAKEDPECECYVVPIPYYEIGENGRPYKLCYEGGLFSKDINITPYELYDIENRQPDIVYIHNPFDDCNRLTRIDPRYFSNKLKNYTDALVYIPYFVEGSSDKNIESYKSYASMPGYINSKYIIVQSEASKKVYTSLGHSDKKVFNLGSPKFDATLLSLGYKQKLDKNMSEKINNKKVFLFNTSISDALNYNRWIDDISNILEVFMNSKESILIWRPHPLIENAIKTMKPNILNKFNNLKKRCLDYENIIIDNNPDVYQAISISDALISDYSSIMLQYLITEKPILVYGDEKWSKDDRIYSTDYLGSYFTSEGTSVENFIEIVSDDNDFKKNERVDRFKKSITNPYGNSGKNIHIAIKSSILKNN